MKVLDLAIMPPIDAGRISAMRPIIASLLPDNAELAASAIERLVRETADSSLGVNGRNKIFGRLKPTVRSVVRRASASALKRLLDSVPKLDRVLGALIVDAISHEALAPMSAELDNLLSGNVHSDIKELILRYKYSRERTTGGEGWPELYDLLRPRPQR
jgi:hypothetical protein